MVVMVMVMATVDRASHGSQCVQHYCISFSLPYWKKLLGHSFCHSRQERLNYLKKSKCIFFYVSKIQNLIF